MTEQDKLAQIALNHTKGRDAFYARPHWTRRQFFEVLGAGVVGSYLVSPYRAQAEVNQAFSVKPKNTAKNVIFILLAGAPSHTDTFDFKMINGVTPATFNPTTVNGILWPTGLMPKLGNMTGDFSIVRSMRSHALVHSLAQTWTQIGRNPAAALGNVAPNIGSIVAMEKEVERRPGQVFPTFVALNSNGATAQGYLSAKFAPMKYNPTTAGLPNTTNADGQTRLNDRWDFLHHIDDPLRVDSPYGKPLEDFNNFYTDAKGLMYNTAVTNSFKVVAADAARYGNTGFGNSCSIAAKILGANQGTRFVQITEGGWDMHQNIYAANTLPAKGKLLDDGLSALISDLKASGLFDETLIVMAGEFGRTVGPLTAAGGRDHYVQQFAFFAGGGIKGGKVIGKTNATGSDVVEYGWSQDRYVWTEDIEATIYSALGINWTTQRDSDILGRTFDYVPEAETNYFQPVHELWP